MKSLDEILADPRAHAAVPSEEQVAAWSERALRRWSEEHAGSTAATRHSARQALTSVLFWGSVGAGLLILGSRFWGSFEVSWDYLRSLPVDVPESMLADFAPHPYWFVALALCLAAALTRPLRELLLDELG